MGSSKPCSLRATICAVKPARSGAFASSSSCTCLVSLSGNEKSVLKSGPTAPATMLTPTRRTTHPPMTIHRCLTHRRASRRRNPVWSFTSMLGVRVAVAFKVFSRRSDRRAALPATKSDELATAFSSDFPRERTGPRTGRCRSFGGQRSVPDDFVRRDPSAPLSNQSEQENSCPCTRICTSRTPPVTR